MTQLNASLDRLDVDIGIPGTLDSLVQSLLQLVGAAFRIQPERVGGGAHENLFTDRQVFPDLQLNLNILCHLLPRRQKNWRHILAQEVPEK